MHAPETILILIAALGLGATHAFEVDHMTAVSTFVANRPTLRQAASFGLQWAAGHGLSLLLFGSVLYLIKMSLTEPVAHRLEQLVGVALIGLGCWTLLQWKKGYFTHSHSHQNSTAANSTAASTLHETSLPGEARAHSHAHPHSREADKHGSLWMGMLHGVAGTAGFMGKSIVAMTQSYWMVFAFTLAFSIGVLLAMGAYAALLGGLLSWGERRAVSLVHGVRLLAGVWSCAVGFYWIFR